MKQTIELPAFRRSAELAPNSIDPETRSVEVIWSTGARVRRAALFGDPYDEELSMAPEHVRLERLNAGAPFLKVHEAHDLDAVIGSVVPGSARIENGQGIARIRLSERDAVGDIWRDIEAGHIRAVSIGYQVHRFEISKPDGQRELWRAVDWTPFEISAVPVGADPAAGFRAKGEHHDCVLHRRDAPTEQGASPMTDKTQTAAEEAEQSNTTAVPEETQMTDETTGAAETQTRAADKKPTATKPAPDPAPEDRARSVDTDALVTEARAQERQRVSTIHGLADKLQLERGFRSAPSTRSCAGRRHILPEVPRQRGAAAAAAARAGLAYNLATFLRCIELPEEMAQWSLTSLQLKLIKIGARVVRHARAITSQLAEVAVTGPMVRAILTAIRAQGERKRQDKSVRYAEKHRHRAGMLRVYGPIHPTSGVCATTDAVQGGKTLDQMAQSGDLNFRRQANWGISVHMKKFIALVAALLLTACGELSTGGSGQTSTGAPVSGLVNWNLDTDVQTVSISSPAGWICTSTFDWNRRSAIMQRTEQLKCNDGSTGRVILSENHIQGQLVGSFQLSNGKTGQVVFGKL